MKRCRYQGKGHNPLDGHSLGVYGKQRHQRAKARLRLHPRHEVASF